MIFNNFFYDWIHLKSTNWSLYRLNVESKTLLWYSLFRKWTVLLKYIIWTKPHWFRSGILFIFCRNHAIQFSKSFQRWNTHTLTNRTGIIMHLLLLYSDLDDIYSLCSYTKHKFILYLNKYTHKYIYVYWFYIKLYKKIYRSVDSWKVLSF